MPRKHTGATNVTVRKGLIDIIEEEIVKPRYLGYTSNAEVIHDGGRLLVVLVLIIKLLTNEPIKSAQLAKLIATLRKKGEEMM